MGPCDDIGGSSLIVIRVSCSLSCGTTSGPVRDATDLNRFKARSRHLFIYALVNPLKESGSGHSAWDPNLVHGTPLKPCIHKHANIQPKPAVVVQSHYTQRDAAPALYPPLDLSLTGGLI